MAEITVPLTELLSGLKPRYRRKLLLQELTVISKETLKVVDTLVRLAKQLDAKGQTKEASKVVAVAETLLANNDKYITLVGEVSRELS